MSNKMCMGFKFKEKIFKLVIWQLCNFILLFSLKMVQHWNYPLDLAVPLFGPFPCAALTLQMLFRLQTTPAVAAHDIYQTMPDGLPRHHKD